ncbi:MAG: UDP-N-acetylmuramate:L-alanyl-gamma-D-glutamyl-meso-diaminopimelate ligase [Methylococcales bacterium]
MRIHIIGICGTFMGGIALLAKQSGYEVSGSDENVYPPMSTLLESQGIQLNSGYLSKNLESLPDLVVIGNALSRGNEEVEFILNKGLPYVSGPQWLREHILTKRWVLAVAGTHGKTTCSSMLAWILEEAGQEPGFLIGGVPLNFGLSARLGGSRFFVVEADEYDTAFFDKRSKFVHYHPRTVVLNNLEFDHADIFPDLDAIQRQFHHLIRTVPGTGLIIRPAIDPNLDNVLRRGCWTPVESTIIISEQSNSLKDGDWGAVLQNKDGGLFDLYYRGALIGSVNWSLTGRHNVHNALSAVAAAYHAGVDPLFSIKALGGFKNVKRRMEVLSMFKGVTIYDDFAHHPTAISNTLEGLRAHVGNERIIAVIELRSNTMRSGIHSDKIPDSLKFADIAIVYQSPEIDWPVSELEGKSENIRVIKTIEGILEALKSEVRSGDHLVFMSNGGFSGIHQKVEKVLQGIQFHPSRTLNPA